MGHRVSESVIIKSPNDKRSYRIIHLSNGLTALLVHDPEIYPDGFTPPEESEGRAAGADEKEGDEDGDLEEDGEDDFDEEEYESEGEEEDEDAEEGEVDGDESEKKGKKGTAPTKKAAAAMCVGMGSFSDPSKAQGLAHFLEHMLFMGSSEFPDENEIIRVSNKSCLSCIGLERHSPMFGIFKKGINCSYCHSIPVMAGDIPTNISNGNRTFQVVVAATRDMGIGKDKKLSWKLSSDLKFFKDVTMTTSDPIKKNAVIMGRKTWEIVPLQNRTLPGRLLLMVARC